MRQGYGSITGADRERLCSVDLFAPVGCFNGSNTYIHTLGQKNSQKGREMKTKSETNETRIYTGDSALDMSSELADAATQSLQNGVRIEDLAQEHYNCSEASIVSGHLQIGNGGEWDGMRLPSGESVQSFLFWMEVQNG